jgi:hypothetical protein
MRSSAKPGFVPNPVAATERGSHSMLIRACRIEPDNIISPVGCVPSLDDIRHVARKYHHDKVPQRAGLAGSHLDC